MQLVSTRGKSPTVTFEEALLAGLAPDGGLYVPCEIPRVDVEAPSWQEADAFAAMAARVLDPWLQAELPYQVLGPLLDDALDFPVPVVPLEGGDWEDVHVLELFHGPTLSFKDFGARFMARAMSRFLEARDDDVLILVATSGDTGSAVADGFAGHEHVHVGLLYPRGQVSPVQERQLVVERPGVQALAVDGTFDDCQRLVKAAFRDTQLASMNLSSANSINIGRLLPQMLYYFWTIRQGGFDDVAFCVPSGNLGNLTGGVLAAMSGLPVRRFVAAHNANDFFPRYLTGEADGYRDSVRTLSNAMDVGAPSNFERLEWLFEGKGMGNKMWGTSVTDDQTLASMRRVYEATGYVADPHTAVGLEGARRYREATGDDGPLVVLSTAHPAKFPETVERALDFKPEAPERLSRLWDEPTQAEPMAPTIEALRDRLLASI